MRKICLLVILSSLISIHNLKAQEKVKAIYERKSVTSIEAEGGINSFNVFGNSFSPYIQLSTNMRNIGFDLRYNIINTDYASLSPRRPYEYDSSYENPELSKPRYANDSWTGSLWMLGFHYSSSNFQSLPSWIQILSCEVGKIKIHDKKNNLEFEGELFGPQIKNLIPIFKSKKSTLYLSTYIAYYAGGISTESGTISNASRLPISITDFGLGLRYQF